MKPDGRPAYLHAPHEASLDRGAKSRCPSK
jgi:hypothetical protein